ncbi:MAG TPA: hypothetical protein VF251_02845, partial [Pyrinomonadaceae bacterium]
REFLTVMFTAAYVESWPIFAVNLVLLPLSLIEVDAIARAYKGYRFFLLKLQIALSVFMVIALWFGISRFGLMGAVSVVVLVNLLLRVVLAAKLVPVLGAKLGDLVLLKDVGKLILASTMGGIGALIVRAVLVCEGTRPFSVLLMCGSAFGLIYVISILLLRVPTDGEREQARRGVGHLQQLIFPRRSLDPIS